jgi:trehalose synthase
VAAGERTGEDGAVQEVPLSPRPLDGLDGLAHEEDLARFEARLADLRPQLAGRTTWHVNSTASGGGVAELLHQLLGYLVAGGVACRWAVIEGDAPFFELTKRIHNRLHGSMGDGGALDGDERAAYRRIVDREAAALLGVARTGDVAVLHDPQTAGMVDPLRRAGLHVVWVCHVGVDRPNDVVRSAWDFLRPEVEAADALVFSRGAYVWDGLDREKVHVIPPCIDPTSPKNAELDATAVGAILGAAGVLAPFEALDEARVDIPSIGSVSVVHPADVVEDAPTPAGAAVVTQISRWDRLKDHAGVLGGFAVHVDPAYDTHLLLAGPSPATVSDDPEGAEVFTEVLEAWKALPIERRERIHLVNLPVDDRVENAVVVNALQRRADVVVQKSLAEGFGLTVAEAMWKARPVVGSELGGIQDQIVDGVSGLLVPPGDPEALGGAITSLIVDLGYAQAIGHAARERVRERFLPPHFLGAHLEVVQRILEG